ncbi:DUF3892 domain-containing protein [Lysinibacillus fusiformis]|uniref:DUF3892 domain-containing protein n=1 Tax=Lysinibacillus fusiformis TaxID=28031 RepID=A0A1H9SFM4_9BACI|nr:DUF3892 domain-containing protein [Lysinibacillus fusiformis]SCY83929.1 Protein of unknown function [Lysinibacillus fusiformis]SEO53870.1 Protein of unknown function [Lysinibacillus fusiformis]SER83761.1 Protein of unknown function [Lysinibacillus fusiformis]
MIKATKIRMHAGREESNSVLEIESIYLIGLSNQPDGFYSKESIHDFVKDTQNRSIHVNISPYPKLIAATNGNQKYVRSAPNDTPEDNLLKLPQEK